jgi:hypothetical protein
MLDIHPPHEAVHTWKDFFIHIATIVIGLIIAIGLEQTVEYIHHRHQVEQIDEALQKESIENREIERADVISLRQLIEALRLNRDGLRSTPVINGEGTYTWQEKWGAWLPLVDSAWLTARDSAIFSLLPADLVRNRWRVEFTMQETNAQGGDFFNTLYTVRSQLHQHGRDVRLTPEERADTVRELTRLDGQLRHLYSTMLYFDAANELYLHQKAITIANLMQLKQSESEPPSW